ncbi:MAG: Na/Pi cotransporter family protein [Candidatus Dojkabacteria bacterium]
MVLTDYNYLQIILVLISALILFLFAIENLSNEVHELAAERFRGIISKLVKNRFIGTIVGAVSTATIQSGSALTVITVALVNTGIISFRDSLGVIFGSNVGATITAQLALVQSAAIAPILIIVGFFLRFFGKRVRLISKPVFFLGLILFALNILSSSIESLRGIPEVTNFFLYLSSPILAYLVSLLFTMLIHSSSISSGIIVILVLGGLLPVDIGIAMILGANLGSSITAFFISSNLTLYAKRAGFANFLFNLLGTVVFMIFLNEFVAFMKVLVADPAYQVAFAHVIFNVISAIVFLIFLTPFEKLVKIIIRGDEDEILFKTKYIDMDVKKDVKERVDDIKQELIYSIENTIKIYQRAIGIFYNSAGSLPMEIKKLETLNDYLDDAISASILQLSKIKLSKDIASQTVTLVKISNTIEQIGDLGDDFSEIFIKMHTLGMKKEDVNIEKLTSIYNKLIELFRYIEKEITVCSEKELLDVKTKEEEIYALIREEYDIHVQRLEVDDAYDGNIFVDAISIIELSVSKVRDIRKLLLKQVREICN